MSPYGSLKIKTVIHILPFAPCFGGAPSRVVGPGGCTGGGANSGPPSCVQDLVGLLWAFVGGSSRTSSVHIKRFCSHERLELKNSRGRSNGWIRSCAGARQEFGEQRVGQKNHLSTPTLRIRREEIKEINLQNGDNFCESELYRKNFVQG